MSWSLSCWIYFRMYLYFSAFLNIEIRTNSWNLSLWMIRNTQIKYDGCWWLGEASRQNIEGKDIDGIFRFQHQKSIGPCMPTSASTVRAENLYILWIIPISNSLNRKCRHFDEISITGCTESCHFDNFRCSQWWKFCQNDDIFGSVLYLLTLNYAHGLVGG